MIQCRVVLAVLLASVSLLVAAQNTAPPPVKREIIPGSELMTPAEREQYRQRFSTAKSPEAQDKVRTEHRQRIRERARLHGLQLPEEPAPSKSVKP